MKTMNQGHKKSLIMFSLNLIKEAKNEEKFQFFV